MFYFDRYSKEFFRVIAPIHTTLAVWKWKSESFSVVSDSLQPQRLYSPWNSPGQNTGVGSHSLLQGICPTQGSNPGLPHCRRILYQLSCQGSPPTPTLSQQCVSSVCSISSLTIGVIILFLFSYSDSYMEVSHWSFNLHFLNDQWGETPFHMFDAIWVEWPIHCIWLGSVLAYFVILIKLGVGSLSFSKVVPVWMLY